MRTAAAGALIDCLQEWGVEVVFGLPGKVTFKQMAHFAESLIRGEPNREKIALTVLADKVRELI
jgi:thiamine pyrophosphate-dependent acetolactate synthase large subunit-like protein